MSSAEWHAATVAGALRLAAAQLGTASATPHLDAELLLAEVLGLSRLWLIAEQRASLTSLSNQTCIFVDMLLAIAVLVPNDSMNIGLRQQHLDDFQAVDG